MRAPVARPGLLAALGLVATSGAFPVEGRFAGSSVADRADPTRTIVLIYNHGFSRERAGTYEALVPPILQQTLERNSDVVLFSQVRNTPRLGRTQHGDYIEAAIDQFRRLTRARVLELCARCSRDSHGAMWDARFGEAFYASHLQPLIDRVRARIRTRAASSR